MKAYLSSLLLGILVTASLASAEGVADKAQLKAKELQALKAFKGHLIVPTYLPKGFKLAGASVMKDDAYRVYYKLASTQITVLSDGDPAEIEMQSPPPPVPKGHKRQSVAHDKFGQGLYEWVPADKTHPTEHSEGRFSRPKGRVVVEGIGPIKTEEFLKVMKSLQELKR